MIVMNATKARENFYQLIRRANDDDEVITITGKNNNIVMISENQWNNIQETLYLESIPGMSESIRTGMAEPESELLTDEEVW